MRGKNTIHLKATLLGAATAMTLATSAHAQEAWTLQPSSPSPTPDAPTAQGPIDAQNPVAKPTADTPAPSAEKPAVLAPVPVINAPPPPPVDAAKTASPAHSTQTPRSETPAALPSTLPPPSAAPLPAAAAPAPVTADTPTPQPLPQPAPVASSETGVFWWWALVPLAAAGLGVALWLRRRRPETTAEQDWSDAPVLETPPEPEAPALARVEPITPTPAFGIGIVTPQPVAQPVPPAATLAPSPVETEFEPLGLRISLYYATLQYRLTLRSPQERIAGHLAIDMISAHGSLPQDEQLAPPVDALGPLRAVPAMQPGEAVTITGELQLSLNAVRPLRQGNVTSLVPLVRLYLLGEGQAPLRRVFTVGAVGAGPALSPLRLDRGPRTVSDLAAREVVLARDLPLSHEAFRAAG